MGSHLKREQGGWCYLMEYTDGTFYGKDHPPNDMIKDIFSKELKKQNNKITVYGGINIRRDLMIKFLRRFRNKEFTYHEAKYHLNDRDTDNSFCAHFQYLKNKGFIEKIPEGVYVFRETVKAWKEKEQKGDNNPENKFYTRCLKCYL